MEQPYQQNQIPTFHEVPQCTHSGFTGSAYDGPTSRMQRSPHMVHEQALPTSSSFDRVALYGPASFFGTRKIDDTALSDGIRTPDPRRTASTQPTAYPFDSTVYGAQRTASSGAPAGRQEAPPLNTFVNRFQAQGHFGSMGPGMRHRPDRQTMRKHSTFSRLTDAVASHPLPQGTTAAPFNVDEAYRAQAAQALASLQMTTAGLSMQAPAVAPPQVAAAAPAPAQITDELRIKQIANGNRRIAGYNSEIKTAAPINIRLPACEIGVVELLTFFPQHTLWPRSLPRFIANKWKTAEVARVQLYARGALTKAACVRRDAALRRQVIDGGNIEFGVQNFTVDTFWRQLTDPQRAGGEGSYNASVYHPRAQHINNLRTASLVDVARDVVAWPAPEDSGIVTQVIELAVLNRWTALTIDDIPQVANHFNFAMPAEAGGTQWDQNGRRRVLAAIEAAGAHI
ncbi:hypothetical protein LTR85_007911 [Meristemomyces frigidus]|nr:hypothetical protein LTR85_007911 [Meristemomyces frigidus]